MDNAKREAFKQEWLKALRSGEYKQTSGVLCNRDGFCCLGVAAHMIHNKFPEIFDEAKVVYKESRYDDNTIAAICLQYGHRDTNMILPRPVLRVLDIHVDFAEELMGKNDNGEDFEHIADYIEAHMGKRPYSDD